MDLVQKLHVNLKRMSLEDYRNAGQNLKINYSYEKTLLGEVFMASTQKGLCFMGFSDGHKPNLLRVKKDFPNAKYTEKKDGFQKQALAVFKKNNTKLSEVALHIKGTDFQFQVWKSLLKIPKGRLTTYSKIATSIKNPKAVRAVGTAIGKNPVSVLVPCHRVIQSSGKLGGYMWGLDRKTALIDWEAKENRNKL